MDVFLIVRRKKTTIFIDAKESWTVLQLKKAVEGILKISPENQQLYKEDTLLEDSKSLSESGFTSASAKAQSPATVGLAVKEGDDFEKLEITDYSVPPELPDVMKPQDSNKASE